MKWMIASDIHGSAFWCEKLMAALEREKADRLILLGDILYHGPRNPLPQAYDTQRVAALLNERRDMITAVRGNCDADIDQMLLDFPMMADYALIENGDSLIFATHGHLHNADKRPPIKAGDVLLHGHTHVPACREYESFLYINPGSVSLPKEASPNSYIVLEKGLFVWKDMSGEEYMRRQTALV